MKHYYYFEVKGKSNIRKKKTTDSRCRWCPLVVTAFTYPVTQHIIYFMRFWMDH